MARRRRVVGRRRYARRVYGRTRRAYARIRRAKKPKPPIEMVLAGAMIPFTPAADSFGGGIWDSIQAQDLTGLADNIKCGFLGFEPARNTNKLDLVGLINPFNMNVGRFTKELIIAGVIGSVRKKISRQSSQLIQRIPLLGRYVS
jgi:hypothetical protein